MHYRYYRPYPYYRRYYNINPYHYRRYYNPYYYNIIDSQIANVDQTIANYNDMTDVIQDSKIYQSRTAILEKSNCKPDVEVDEQSEPINVEKIPIEDSSEKFDEKPTPEVF